MANLAFISYSHHDAKVAEWLQGKLEHFHVPRHWSNPVNCSCGYLRPIFRDRTDMSAGVLSEVIEKNLEKSKFLIVICSPHSAQSVWVSKEVQYFFEHGRMENVIPVIVEGTPYCGDERECMPIFMRQYVAEHPGQELLCFNFATEGKFYVLSHVIARLLNVPYEAFCNRYKKRLARKLAAHLISAFTLIVAGCYSLIPVHGRIALVDESSELPHGAGTLTVNGQIFPINQYDTVVELPSCPGYCRGQKMEVQFSAPYYQAQQMTFTRSFGFNTECQLQLRRDDTFSVFAGKVVDADQLPIEGASVTIGDQTVLTNKTGYFSITIPVESQTSTKVVNISKPGFSDIIREDECPNLELIYIMYEK